MIPDVTAPRLGRHRVRDQPLGTQAFDRLDLAQRPATVGASGVNVQDANHRALPAAGHWGVPSVVLEGEVFYGQDGLDQLLWRIGQGAGGDAPFVNVNVLPMDENKVSAAHTVIVEDNLIEAVGGAGCGRSRSAEAWRRRRWAPDSR